MYGPYGHAWMFDGGAGLFLGGLWMLLMWGMPVLVIVALLKYLLGKPRADRSADAAPGKAALDILKESYARGDISREEYLQKRDDLADKK